MPNNYLSVLYKHIIQVENKNVGLKEGGGGHKHLFIYLFIYIIRLVILHTTNMWIRQVITGPTVFVILIG